MSDHKIEANSNLFVGNAPNLNFERILVYKNRKEDKKTTLKLFVQDVFFRNVSVGIIRSLNPEEEIIKMTARKLDMKNFKLPAAIP